MKKLIVLMLIILTASALAYKLPTAWTLGGGLGTDSMRITIYRTGAANTTLTTVTDTGFVTSTAASKQGGNRTFNVDSLVAYTIRYMYFVAPDTFREYVQDVFPIEYAQLTRAYLADLDTATQAIRDSMEEASTAGAVTLTQSDIDSIVAGVIAGTITANGTGIFAVTMYARDTINNAFVPGVNLTAVSGATNLFATTSSTGAATFNVDAATWTFNALGSPYTWVPFTRAVAGNITDTITGGGVSIIPSSNPDLATIYGIIDRNGSPVSGLAVSVVLTRPDTLTIDDAFIDFNHTVYTDANGVWEDDVYFLAGSTRNFYYTVTFTVAGLKRTLYCRPTASGGPYLINDIMVEKP